VSVEACGKREGGKGERRERISSSLAKKGGGGGGVFIVGGRFLTVGRRIGILPQERETFSYLFKKDRVFVSRKKDRGVLYPPAGGTACL